MPWVAVDTFSHVLLEHRLRGIPSRGARRRERAGKREHGREHRRVVLRVWVSGTERAHSTLALLALENEGHGTFHTGKYKDKISKANLAQQHS